MSKQEIEDIKSEFSKKDKEGNFSKAWVKTPGEMYKKTVLRRLCKLIELDFDSIESKKTYQETSDFEFEDKSEHEISNFDKDNIIEADAEIEENNVFEEGVEENDGN